jgi:S1-C subfamily serine protease
MRAACALAALCTAFAVHAMDMQDTIARVKRSIVAVGTFERGRNPAFRFRGTGFAVADGTTIVTNAHVIHEFVDPTHNEVLAILVPDAGGTEGRAREVREVAVDVNSDLALLKLSGDPLPPLELGDAATIREGQVILMTGFPLGGVLGPFAATHRGMISAITPIAIPQARAADLDPAIVRRITRGAFPVFQLDATAYPGNSGSPIYDPVTGKALGIVNMVFVKGTKEAALTQPSGITYAVPVDHLQALLKSAASATGKN